ncbi:MAG: AarF/UbiB family protein, partial [Acidobacteriota bacterium]
MRHRSALARVTLAGALFSLILHAPVAHSEISLPTPREHYQNYDPRVAALALFTGLMVELDPETRTRIGSAVAAGAPSLETFADEELMEVLTTLDWMKWRSQILELLLHASSALEVTPSSAKKWLPAVHDSLLLFLDRLPEERLAERLLELARMPREASRGDRLLAFVSRTPTLQKLGQILARHPDVEPELGRALQTLENSLATASRQEVVGAIERELGRDVLEEYRFRFADNVLAEASVGAVIQVRFLRPGEEAWQQAVCKVLKPYAVSGIKEELAALDEILAFLEEHGEFYELGATPLVEMFEEVRAALSREILVEEEQRNLARAASYYGNRDDIVIPKIYPFSTPGVTCMEYVEGEKITDAFPEDPEARSRLARKFNDIMTFDVIFSPQEEALFHGDPHPGNIFHVLDGEENPYRIALLDWGLLGVFPREQRAKLVQLLVGLYLGDVKRLSNNVDSLFEGDASQGLDEESRRALVREVLERRNGQNAFEILNALVAKLARQGYRLRFNTVVFIKSQVTIYGLLKELDPEIERDDYLMDRLSGQVYRELPKRLLRTVWFPAWNSHDYRSMLSNEDVKDIQVKRTARAVKKLGRAVWRG